MVRDRRCGLFVGGVFRDAPTVSVNLSGLGYSVVPGYGNSRRGIGILEEVLSNRNSRFHVTHDLPERLAEAYRKRFGEKPSETLRKA